MNGNPKESFSYVSNYLKMRKEVEQSHKNYNFPLNKSGKTIIDTLHRTSFSQPFFLFINFMEFHEPYVKNFNPQKEQEYSLGIFTPTKRTINEVRNSYYLESKNVDWEIGEVIRFLKKSGIFEETTLMITSDHGQSLFENGFYGHSTYLYNELINVPLILKRATSNPKCQIVNQLFSNIGLFDLIKSIACDGEIIAPDFPFIISEADGSGKVPKSLIVKNKEASQRLSNMNSQRRAIFKDDFKLVLNMKNGNVESFEKKEKPIKKEEYKVEFIDLMETIELLGKD